MNNAEHPSVEISINRDGIVSVTEIHGDAALAIIHERQERNALALRAAELEEQLYRERGEHLDAVGLLEAQLSTLTRLATSVVEAAEAVPIMYAEEEDLPKAVSLRDAHCALRSFLSTTPPPPDRLRELAMAVVKAKDCKLCPFCGVNGDEWEDHKDGCELGALAKFLRKAE